MIQKQMWKFEKENRTETDGFLTWEAIDAWFEYSDGSILWWIDCATPWSCSLTSVLSSPVSPIDNLSQLDGKWSLQAVKRNKHDEFK